MGKILTQETLYQNVSVKDNDNVICSAECEVVLCR